MNFQGEGGPDPPVPFYCICAWRDFIKFDKSRLGFNEIVQKQNEYFGPNTGLFGGMHSATTNNQEDHYMKIISILFRCTGE